jgi:hypothetical protein
MTWIFDEYPNSRATLPWRGIAARVKTKAAAKEEIQKSLPETTHKLKGGRKSNHKLPKGVNVQLVSINPKNIPNLIEKSIRYP